MCTISKYGMISACLHDCWFTHTANINKPFSPWKEAILYMLGHSKNSRYDSIFKKQFFNINEDKHLPLREFIDKLCENFPRYQRFVDGEYQIVPREKQKRFLERIICGEECFHFSEVGTGKTKGENILCLMLMSTEILNAKIFFRCQLLQL